MDSLAKDRVTAWSAVRRVIVLALASMWLVGSTAEADAVLSQVDFAPLPDGPRTVVMTAALAAYDTAVAQGVVARGGLVTIIDYTLPSTEPRLWVVDITKGRVLFRELVAHGKNSGDNFATRFSNQVGSLMSSRGVFVTESVYIGRNGYSLHLRGLMPGVNDRARERAIVMHGAAYVSEATVARLGRLGRSWGCPALRLSIARKLIDTIAGGSVLFAYAP